MRCGTDFVRRIRFHLYDVGMYIKEGEVMLKKIWGLISYFLTPLSNEEAWEAGVITPQLRKEPTTEPRLKALVPDNDSLKFREAEIDEARSRADEAGVVPPR